MGICIREDCDRPTVGAGLCSAHYQRAKYHGELPDLDPAKRTCAHCGELMTGRTHHRAKFCSKRCKEAARVELKRTERQAILRERSCLTCGGPIPLDSSMKTRCCSKQCSITYQNRKRAVLTEAAKGGREQLCKWCGEDIPQDRRNGVLYCSTACKRRAMSARWRERAPHYMRLYLYGLTPEEYDAMMAAQDSRCAICGSAEWPGKDGKPNVDHCAKTVFPGEPKRKFVRGILCGNCNNGLGMFDHDPDRLRAAAEYMDRANAALAAELAAAAVT